MMMNGAGWMGWGGGLMWLFWILLIVAVVFLIRSLWPRDSEDKPTDALEILRQRYARGEIDEAEFARRKKELSS